MESDGYVSGSKPLINNASLAPGVCDEIANIEAEFQEIMKKFQIATRKILSFGDQDDKSELEVVSDHDNSSSLTFGGDSGSTTLTEGQVEVISSLHPDDVSNIGIILPNPIEFTLNHR